MEIKVFYLYVTYEIMSKTYIGLSILKYVKIVSARCLIHSGCSINIYIMNKCEVKHKNYHSTSVQSNVLQLQCLTHSMKNQLSLVLRIKLKISI